ncbi:helix-turn-helix domain-containing protein [Paenibacillus polymyxa]|uniref:helix-turn-helix domain-containing protein n=1 Tax=Paenibacillus polymyxa TaxID=1406 RepID=UPI0025B6EDCE|nr:helix-turn-helix transcriptional regulator [Paenibacillus polymyxa]MDN4106156.1 helix-turn-helix transcriptional regulator [Paenibacillus polymyxa]
MEITPTIRAELGKYLKREGLTMTGFALIAGMNPGTVSGIVTGNRNISALQLDLITKGMNLTPDHFFDSYVNECVLDKPTNWKRISPFLYRCIELNRLDCLKKVVGMLLDYPTYLPQLFDLAEESFKNGYKEAAAYLFENVAESEKHQHSERLAVSQYRLFQLAIGKDRNRNLDAATKFETFVNRLSEVDQLDALKDLSNVFRSLSKWDKVYKYSEQMGRMGKAYYDLVHNSERREQESHKDLSRPLFVYIAYAELMCANACDAKGNHKLALKHLNNYTDLSWVKEKDPDTLLWIGKFQHWAKINTYVNRLMSGDVSVLPDYVEYMAGEEHIFAELLNVIEAANRYNVDVDYILQRFESKIAAYQESFSSDMYSQQFLPQQYARFWYKLAKYSLNKGRYQYGFKCLIHSLEKAGTINHARLIANCAGLFDRFREYAAPETLAQYHFIYQEVWETNDEKDGFVFDDE